ncbi:MAG: RIFT barrel domain-containing protein [Armatimonadota bacterium]
MLRFARFALLTTLLLAVALPALAQDTDNDTVPDEIELALGMNPRQAEALTLVHDDKSRAEGDKLPAAHKLAPDLTRVYFGNVAGDRYVWRLDFAEDFVEAGMVLILYLDADNALITGRQDGAKGCDVMLTCVQGLFEPSIRNEDVATANRKQRGVIRGRSVYFCMDLKLKQTESGQSNWRAWVLCHRSEPNNADQDNTTQFTVTGAGYSNKVKPKIGVVSEYRSENMRVETPWLGWRADLRRMGAVTLDASKATLTGMRLFDRALIPQNPGSRAVFRSPKAGSYHIGVVVQDSAAGAEEIVLRAQGKQIGKLVCLQNDGVFHLFTSANPVKLRQGDGIELIAAAPMQDFQISEVLLCPQVPVPGPLAISNLATYCPPQPGKTVTVDVCFTTNYPCTAGARWGSGKMLDKQAAEETEPTYNHRLRLTGLQRGGQYTVQVNTGKAYDSIPSRPLSFIADQPRLSRCGVAKETAALQITDSLPQVRTNWPVKGGVPLRKGALSDASHCRLLDAEGRSVPAQFDELSYWPDGSVKWLLVSLLHTGGKPDYVLEYGEQVKAQMVRGVKVEETTDGLIITNGRLQTTLSRSHFAPPGVVKLDSNGDGNFEDEKVVCSGTEGFVLTDAAGNRYTSSAAPAELLVEEAGPVRTVVLAQGKLAGEKGKLMTWRCRMTFNSGFTGIPTVFTLLNDEGKSVSPPTMTLIKSLTVPVTVNAATRQERRRWVQDDVDHQLVEAQGKTTAQAGQGPQFAGLGGVGVTIKDFWQMYPKAFTVEGDTITAEIFPELPADAYADQTDPKLLTQHYYWAKQGKYQIPMGVALSYDLLFSFGDDDIERTAQAWQAPVLLSASPAQYCGSGAFADLAPEKPGVFEDFHKYVRTGLENIEAVCQRGKEYSWMDYGDWYGERSVNWGNQEYDLQWGLMLQFARSGDLRFFDRAEQAARHTASVDTIMAAPTPNRIGVQLVHCLGHTGGFGIPRVPEAQYWFEGGGFNSGHMWSQGTYTTYCLTGDRRYLEAADALANWLSGPYLRGFEYYVHRNYGWPTVAVLGGYDVTANPYFLNAGRLFTQYVISKQDPGTGVLAHPIGECSHKPLHMGGKVFMSGAVMTGMKMLDRVAPSDDLKLAIVRNCDWMYHRMWHPRDNSFQYAQCTDFDSGSTHAGTYEACEGLAYAYTVTKNPIYREMLERSLADAIGRGPARIGKEYAMQIRMSPFALSEMDRWGMRSLPAPPPPGPSVTFDSRLYFTDQSAQITCTAENRTGKPLVVDARLLSVPGGIEVDAKQAQWEVPSTGISTRSMFQLEGAAKPGQTIKLEFEMQGKKQQVEIALVSAQALRLGTAIGYLGSAEDPAGLALAKMGKGLPRLDDLRPETLAGYAALLVGTEGHSKDYAGLKETPERLLDFIYSGGKVALLQLQDAGYQSHFLPYPLVMSDADASCRDLLLPQHPLFSAPQQVASLRGAMSYDTITYADPRWTVLAKDSRGGPSIVEAAFGKGKVLVVQPSPDRYVTGELATPVGLQVQTCVDFLENVLSWLGTS